MRTPTLLLVSPAAREKQQTAWTTRRLGVKIG
jgi:hypothetical protein